MYLVLSINPSIKVVQINSICRFITEIFTDSKLLQIANKINYWKFLHMEYKRQYLEQLCITLAAHQVGLSGHLYEVWL